MYLSMALAVLAVRAVLAVLAVLGEADFRLAFFIFGISRPRPEKSNIRKWQYLDQRQYVLAIFPSA